MKKLMTLALAALVLLGTTGCTKKYYTTVEGAQLEWVDFSVTSSQWQLNEDMGLYYITLNVPQITKAVVENGAVQVARQLETDIWQPLPMSRAEAAETEEGELILYSVYTDYEWTIGKVTVFVTATDFYTGDRPDDMYFRVNIFKN